MTRDTRLVLTVELCVPGEDPGGPTRIATVLSRIARNIRSGNTAGEFEQDYSYSLGGESNRDSADITWRIKREGPTMREPVQGRQMSRSEADDVRDEVERNMDVVPGTRRFDR